jgi:hypothetical protein
VTIVSIVAATSERAGDLTGNWDWPVLLLVPLALVLALLTALALGGASDARGARRRQGGTSRALARHADDRPASD